MFGESVNGISENISHSLNYDVVVNNVALNASKTISEDLEEGVYGSVHSFNIEFENLENINITSDNSNHTISLSENGDYSSTLNITNLDASPYSLFILVNGLMRSNRHFHSVFRNRKH